jgi:hypothetical protein
MEIGEFSMSEDRPFAVTITNAEAAKWVNSIYAAVIGGTVVRVGSSEGRLGSRLRSYAGDCPP